MKTPSSKSIVALVATLSLLAGATAHAGSVALTKGSVTFTQGGEKAAWKLSTGVIATGSKGDPGVTLSFSPDAGSPGASSLSLAFTASKPPAHVDIRLRQGPAGRDWKSAPGTSCTLTIDEIDGKGIKGSGACEDAKRPGEVPTGIFFAASP